MMKLSINHPEPYPLKSGNPVTAVVQDDGENTINVKDNEYLITALPQPKTDDIRRDGYAQCFLTGECNAHIVRRTAR